MIRLLGLLRVKLYARWQQTFQWKGPIPIPRGVGRSTKSENRNKFKCYKSKWLAFVWCFELLNFEFVSVPRLAGSIFAFLEASNLFSPGYAGLGFCLGGRLLPPLRDRSRPVL